MASTTDKTEEDSDQSRGSREITLRVRLLCNSKAVVTPCALEDNVHGINGREQRIDIEEDVPFSSIMNLIRDSFSELKSVDFTLWRASFNMCDKEHKKIIQLHPTTPINERKITTIYVRPEVNLTNVHEGRRFDELCPVCVSGMLFLQWKDDDGQNVLPPLAINQRTDSAQAVLPVGIEESEIYNFEDVDSFSSADEDALRTKLALLTIQSDDQQEEILLEFGRVALRNALRPSSIEVERGLNIQDFLKCTFYKERESSESMDVYQAFEIHFFNQQDYVTSIDHRGRRNFYNSKLYHNPDQVQGIIEGEAGWYRFKLTTTVTQLHICRAAIEFTLNNVLQGGDGFYGMNPCFIAAVLCADINWRTIDYRSLPPRAIVDPERRLVWKNIQKILLTGTSDEMSYTQIVRALEEMCVDSISPTQDIEEIAVSFCKQVFVVENGKAIAYVKQLLKATRIAELLRLRPVVEKYLFAKARIVTSNDVMAKIRFDTDVLSTSAADHVQALVTDFITKYSGDVQLLKRFCFAVSHSFSPDLEIMVVTPLFGQASNPFSFNALVKQLEVRADASSEEFETKLIAHLRSNIV